MIEFADTRPDEYFFFDVHGSCAVERLITATGTVPCETCGFKPCDYRRAPHSRRRQRQP
jgi:hypothetical protein